MRRWFVITYTVLAVSGLLSAGIAASAEPPADNSANAKPSLQPGVAALLRDATAAYQRMRSYQHTAEYLERTSQGGIEKDTAYTLALERPNKFAFRSDDANETAAVSDGKLYTNFKGGDEKTFTRITAPASFKEIDIVNDVEFKPIGTYLIALMLQGDALADKDVRAAIEAAGAPGTAQEEGKHYNTITIKFGQEKAPLTIYFDAETHLLHKVILDSPQGRISEIIENVKIDKPIPASAFQYTPPASAQWIARVGSRTNKTIALAKE